MGDGNWTFDEGAGKINDSDGMLASVFFVTFHTITGTTANSCTITNGTNEITIKVEEIKE